MAAAPGSLGSLQTIADSYFGVEAKVRNILPALLSFNVGIQIRNTAQALLSFVGGGRACEPPGRARTVAIFVDIFGKIHRESDNPLENTADKRRPVGQQS